MGDTIRKFKTFPFYDYPGVEQYLEDMGLQGWMLEKYSWGIWKFRKAEPQNVHYEVVYDRQRDLLPSKRTEQREKIAQGEWTLCAEWKDTEIYHSMQAETYAIGGDAAKRLELMHRYRGGRTQVCNLVLFVLLCAVVFFDVKEIAANPVKLLSMNTKLAVLTIWIVLAVHAIWEWFEYRHWRKNMKEVLSNEVVKNASGYHTSYQARQILMGMALLFAVVAYWLDGGWQLVMVLLFFVAVLGGGCWIARWIARKSKFTTEGENIIGAVTVCVIMFLLLFGLSNSTGFQKALFSKEEPIDIVYIGNNQYPIYNDDMLVTIEELGVAAGDSKYTKKVDEQESFLLKRTLAQQAVIPYSHKIPYDMAKPEISYELVDVKAGFLYDICKDSVENRLITHVRQGHLYNSVLQSAIDDFAPTTLEAQYSKVEALSDDMVSVYRIEHQENDDAYGYLLLWPDRIAAVCMTYEASEEQLVIIIDAMAPTK